MSLLYFYGEGNTHRKVTEEEMGQSSSGQNSSRAFRCPWQRREDGSLRISRWVEMESQEGPPCYSQWLWAHQYSKTWGQLMGTLVVRTRVRSIRFQDAQLYWHWQVDHLYFLFSLQSVERCHQKDQKPGKEVLLWCEGQTVWHSEGKPVSIRSHVGSKWINPLRCSQNECIFCKAPP